MEGLGGEKQDAGINKCADAAAEEQQDGLMNKIKAGSLKGNSHEHLPRGSIDTYNWKIIAI